MINNKLIGLLVIVLAISSCISISAAALPVAPMATGMPFPFGPSPTPTPTPAPPTPTPTPKPEPTVWPALDIRCVSTATESNLQVLVSGTLSYNNTAISNAAVYLGFSEDGGSSWENFTLTQTHSDGSYSAVWSPNSTGNYLVNTHWDGNDSLHWLDARATLVLTPDSAGNVFAVVSNSTITGYAYNATTQILSFNTNGTKDSTGYLYACIPKAVLSDVNALKVSKDGQPVTFSSESQNDVWVVSCVYSQSVHGFTVEIPFVSILSPAEMPWTIIAAGIAIVLIVVVALAVVIRRKRRMAKTVASILKENRQQF